MIYHWHTGYICRQWFRMILILARDYYTREREKGFDRILQRPYCKIHSDTLFRHFSLEFKHIYIHAYYQIKWMTWNSATGLLLGRYLAFSNMRRACPPCYFTEHMTFVFLSLSHFLKIITAHIWILSSLHQSTSTSFFLLHIFYFFCFCIHFSHSNLSILNLHLRCFFVFVAILMFFSPFSFLSTPVYICNR